MLIDFFYQILTISGLLAAFFLIVSGVAITFYKLLANGKLPLKRLQRFQLVRYRYRFDEKLVVHFILGASLFVGLLILMQLTQLSRIYGLILISVAWLFELVMIWYKRRQNLSAKHFLRVLGGIIVLSLLFFFTYRGYLSSYFIIADMKEEILAGRLFVFLISSLVGVLLLIFYQRIHAFLKK